MPAEEELLAHLKALEISLHQPEIATDPVRMAAILHEDFVEFGSSGGTYARRDILIALSEAPGSAAPRLLWSQDFRLHRHDDSSALLLYRSAQIGYDGKLTRHTLRSSLWQKTARGWRMVFHQGTPTLPFEAAVENESAPHEGA